MDNHNTMNTAEITSDEKLLALLSYLSVVLGGIILPIVVWAVKKDQSKFIRFHSLQAIFYHIAVGVIIAVIVIILVAVILMVAGLGALTAHHGSDTMPALLMIFIFIFYGFIFLLALGSIGYGIYLAVKSYGGAIIKVPFIGNIIHRKVYGNG